MEFEKIKVLGQDYAIIILNIKHSILLCLDDINIRSNSKENLDYGVTLMFIDFKEKSVYKTKMSLYVSKITGSIDYLFDVELKENDIMPDKLLRNSPKNSFIYKINDYVIEKSLI